MNTQNRSNNRLLVLFGVALAIGGLAAIACGGDSNDTAAKTEPSTLTIEITTDVPPTAASEPTAASQGAGGGITFEAASATLIVDGDTSDWEDIEGVTVTLAQFDLPPGVTFDSLDWDEPNPLDPVDATVRVAIDSDNLYMLLEVPDDYDYVPDDHGLSASPNVMFLIDPEAGPHMGSGDDNYETSLGMVDLWHWELDCGPGVLSGGGDPGGGDDPDCNLDDEFATDPEDREDDGGGNSPNPAAENTLAGVWEHTGRASGIGADGTWIFEMSRPLQTGDPEDVQFASGGTVLIALAYYDADETNDGWTGEGHLQSAGEGWIEVTLP